MLDDYKYSIGRLVVYEHSNPKLPRQSYGQYGHERTVGEIVSVGMAPKPSPHWIYEIRNVRNQELTKIPEAKIKFAASAGRYWKKSPRRVQEARVQDGELAEMIARALTNPQSDNFITSTLKELLFKEELAAKAASEGAELPIEPGDYIRVRGDLRNELSEINNHYAKVLKVEPSDIAGIENSMFTPGQPRIFRTLKKITIKTSEGVEETIYDAEVKLFYTAYGRKTILNWRAATLLAEAFGDEAPYNLNYEYLAEHVFTRDELKGKKRKELSELLAEILYVKGKIGWREFQRRGHFFTGTPRSHLVDSILETSRFDAKKNRVMSIQEIESKRHEYYKLRRILKA